LAIIREVLEASTQRGREAVRAITDDTLRKFLLLGACINSGRHLKVTSIAVIQHSVINNNLASAATSHPSDVFTNAAVTD